MKQELQNPAPWINSRYNPGVEQPESERDPEGQDGLLDDIMRLESQVDTALSVALFLGGLLLIILMVEYIMWVNGLLLIMH